MSESIAQDNVTLPLVIHEDDHLLAIHKPSGVNTHKPDRFAQDGIHEWLQKQRPEWRALSILHRLDKETSGVMVFGKTTLANKSLTQQFESGAVEKTYLLLTKAVPDTLTKTISTPIEGKPAKTTFRVVERLGEVTLVEALPGTGRTHQVRIHATQAGLPILGDATHGETIPGIPRMMLHAYRIEFRHPKTGEPTRLQAPSAVFETKIDSHSRKLAWSCAGEFRGLLFDPGLTNAYRLIATVADGCPDLTADRYGEALLVRSNAIHRAREVLTAIEPPFRSFLQDDSPGARSKPETVVAAVGDRGPFGAGPEPRSPTAATATSFVALENGLRFQIRMDQGFSPGLFLDQRENRRHLRSLANGKDVLNCFAYTCAFSVAAAAGGGKATSLDLSKAYLDWGRENVRLNDLNPDEHDFIYGDVFDWLKRFAKRDRQWDIVLLDPPTFGTSKTGRVFRAAKDYRELVELAAKLVRRGGTLFCSTNQRTLAPDQFEKTIREGLRTAGRDVRSLRFETQPLDFRVAEGEKPYLKTFWAELA